MKYLRLKNINATQPITNPLTHKQHSSYENTQRMINIQHLKLIIFSDIFQLHKNDILSKILWKIKKRLTSNK